MNIANAEKETNYRIAMALVSILIKKGILTKDEAKLTKNLLIDELQPFIGRLERDI